MTPGARPPWSLVALFLGLPLLASSCTALPPRSGVIPPQSREVGSRSAGYVRPEDASAFRRIPSEGTIVFYEPRPNPGKRRVRPQPTTITITTELEKGRVPDVPVGTSAGTIDEEETTERPTRKEVRRQILERARQRSAYTVTPQRFGLLWADLERIGVFELPRHRGGIPPEDKPSIRMTGNGRSWIFLRPTDVDQETLPKRREDLERIMNAWTTAKLAIVRFSL